MTNYVATWSVVGYLPTMDQVEPFDYAAQAWEFLQNEVSDHKNDLNEQYDYLIENCGNLHDMAALAEELESCEQAWLDMDVNAHHAFLGSVEVERPGTLLTLIYSVQEMEE